MIQISILKNTEKCKEIIMTHNGTCETKYKAFETLFASKLLTYLMLDTWTNSNEVNQHFETIEAMINYCKKDFMRIHELEVANG